MELRRYQTRTIERVELLWKLGIQSVCLASPTGSGKTTMGAALARGRCVWVAHRRELITQAAERLQSEGLDVGVICPDVAPRPDAPIQVGTIQTLLARNVRPPADRL